MIDELLDDLSGKFNAVASEITAKSKTPFASRCERVLSDPVGCFSG